MSFSLSSPYSFRYFIEEEAQWTYQNSIISTAATKRIMSIRFEQKNKLSAPELKENKSKNPNPASFTITRYSRSWKVAAESRKDSNLAKQLDFNV